MLKSKNLESEIKTVADKFIEVSSNKDILIISHFDTDGITSAAILMQTLRKLDKKFSLRILKRLEEETILNLPKDKVIIFLDLASGSLNHLAKINAKDIFILDHHEIFQEIPEGINIVNPHLNGKEDISSSGLVYLFCRHISEENKELAKLAVLGMIGDSMEKSIDKLNNLIINDGEVKKKRGLLIYPSTRPLNRTLEYCSDPYIPGVTGNAAGVTELLREINLGSQPGKYKSLLELNDEEMSRLVTAIILKNPQVKNREIIGDIFLIKFFNKLEDARELSAIINACSRLGETETALQFCMESLKAKKRAEIIHTRYRQFIISGLKSIAESEKIEGNGFVIINAREKIKDTMIGTIASIISNSSIYEEGTIVTTMAYYDDKIKVSARSVGRSNRRNVREILTSVIEKTGGEVGGHKFAAGCMLKQEKEREFIDFLKKSLEIELVKI
jgi:RecJ-like exonuclease